MESTATSRASSARAGVAAALAEASERIGALGRSLGVRGRLVPAEAEGHGDATSCPGRMRCGVAPEHCARQWRARQVNGAGRYDCAAGLSWLVAPVRRGGVVLGRGEFGPFRPGEPDVAGGAMAGGNRWDDAVVPVLPEPVVAGAIAVLAEIGRRGAPATTHEALRAVPPAVRWTLRQIEDNLGEPLGVGRLAATVGLSADHFARVFKAATGRSVSAYVNWRRVQRATELLAATDCRVGEIAFACGFESVPHFNRMFRRQTGVTPTACRASLCPGPAALRGVEFVESRAE